MIIEVCRCMRKENTIIVWGTLLVILVSILCALILNPIHKKNTEKFNKPKPVDGTEINSDDLSGNVESIHPWGRTEIVPMKSVELEYFEYCDQWVMYGDVVQPTGRKNYFMPVMKGYLDLNVKDLTQTWVEHEIIETMSTEKPETFEDFRVANIHVKSGRVVNIKYSHYRLDSDKSWSIIASWEAKFSE